MRDALSILDMCLGYGKEVNEELVRTVLGTSDRAFLFRFSQALAEENAAEVIRLIDELMRDGKDPRFFSRDVSGHLADAASGQMLRRGVWNDSGDDGGGYRRISPGERGVSRFKADGHAGSVYASGDGSDGEFQWQANPGFEIIAAA